MNGGKAKWLEERNICRRIITCCISANFCGIAALREYFGCGLSNMLDGIWLGSRP